MKKIIKGILVLLLCVGVVGCGKSDEKEDEKENKTLSQETDKDTVKDTAEDTVKRDNLDLLEKNGYSLIKNSDLEFIVSKGEYSMQFIVYNKEIRSQAVIQGKKNPTGNYNFFSIETNSGVRVENSQIVYSYNFNTGTVDYGNISDEDLLVLVDMNSWYEDFMKLGIKIDVLSKEIVNTYYN